MAKAPLYGPNQGFAMWSPPTGARLGVVQLGRDVAGSGFSSPNFSFRFSREGDLPDFMARRISVTVSKFMFAVAQLYVEGGLFAPVTVEGRTGPARQGQLLPDHGPGRQGVPVGDRGGPLRDRDGDPAGRGAQRAGGPPGPGSGGRRPASPPATPAEFAANGSLAGYGLAHDASTYLAPAFVNQAEGKQEAFKQPLMTGLLPLFIPDGPGSLELALNAVGVASPRSSRGTRRP